ncbi:MAG TPA: EAL domain-containing protein [Terracidiphilus sp.]|nr:EAL domain-containing protein [Terracidiphilus sp.]
MVFQILLERQQVVSVSEGVEQLLGFSQSQFLAGAISLADRVHTGDLDIVDRIFSPGQDLASQVFNLRVRHADGRILCLVGNTSHKVQQKRSLLVLRLQDAKLLGRFTGDPHPTSYMEIVMESVNERVCLKDRHHVYVGANQLFRSSLASDQSALPEISGLTDYDLFPEEIADHLYEIDKKVLSGIPFAHEIREARTADGQIGWSDERCFLVKDADAEIVGVFNISADITEGVLRQKALEASEESLREAQKIARLGSFEVDLQTQVWTGTDVLYDILGLDRDIEPTVSRWIHLIHEDDLAALSAAFTAATHDEDALFGRECRVFLQPTKALRWVHIRGKVEFDRHRTPVRVKGTIQDITDRKVAEAALQESSGLLQIFIQDAPTGLAMFDREMRYLAASRRWIEDNGLKEENVIGRSQYDLMPEIPEHWREEHRRALAGETVVASDDSYRDRTGVTHWKRRMMRPWLTGSGAIGGIVVLAEDVTQRKLAELALRESKELLQLFIDHAPAALAMFDSEMRYLAASRRWIEDHGLTGRTIVGEPHYLIDLDIPELWKEQHRRALAGETIRVAEDPWTRADGSVKWLRREIRPWMTGDGAIGGIMIFSENITSQKIAAERLHLAASVFAHAAEGIMITDAAGTILEVNDAFTRITGYARDEIVGKNPRILNSGRQSREFYENLWNQLRLKGHWSGEIWNRAKDGHIYAEMLTISAVKDSGGKTQQYVAMFSDITSIKEQKQQLEQVARHDLLTGLPNRVLLADRLRVAMAQAHRHGKPVAIACLDLDNFRTLNDQHGHAVGDKLLTALARRMRAALHEDDTLARLGGDEFVAVMPELDAVDDSMAIVNALQNAVSDPVQVDDLVFQLSASIGVTFFPQSEDVDADQLLRQADQSMYQAKLEGKSRFHLFDPSGDRNLRGHHEDIERIRNALKAEEFVLYFQPKVNMRTGEFLGAEGLIRWQHPLSGLLPPGQFLPVIEGHALSIDIGEWVIDKALQHIEGWLAEGFDVPVSVNVPPLQLQQPGFVDRVRELLAAHPGVPGSRLELEVLESSALEDLSLVSKVIHDCRELGVSFAMDDFGTGYSSLSYLKRLPVDVLKIDQAFVHDMLDDPDDLMILEGVLALSRSFHRDAIAEGVETVEHGLMLLRMGCEKAQGYGIARPMPAGELAGWAAKWRPYPEWANIRALETGDLPLLSACAELRAWIVAIEAYIAGRRQSVPLLKHHECRFGAWLLSETRARRANRPGFKEIDALHQQVHTFANELIALKSNGHDGSARAGSEELRGLRDQLCAKLEKLLQSLCDPAASTGSQR